VCPGEKRHVKVTSILLLTI